MRFCIPIDDAPHGGSYVFLRYLRAFLEDNGHRVTRDPDEYHDVLFAISFMVPAGLIRRAKSRFADLKVVHRVDGSAREYGRYDGADMRLASVNLLADLTVFQSYYGRYATKRKRKIISNDGPVIHNPVDLQVFRPSDFSPLRDARPISLCHTVHSTNPMKGVANVYSVAAACPDVEFVLCGTYRNIPKLPNVSVRERVSHRDLADIYRSCHAYVTFTENDACPNTVIEALASGLPVLYLKSGGTPELVGSAAGLATTVTTFRDDLQTLLRSREVMSAAARTRAEMLFAPEHIFARYIEEIRSAKRRKLPSGFRRTHCVVRTLSIDFPTAGWFLKSRFSHLKSVAAKSVRRFGNFAQTLGG